MNPCIYMHGALRTEPSGTKQSVTESTTFEQLFRAAISSALAAPGQGCPAISSALAPPGQARSNSLAATRQPFRVLRRHRGRSKRPVRAPNWLRCNEEQLFRMVKLARNTHEAQMVQSTVRSEMEFNISEIGLPTCVFVGQEHM